VGPPGQPQVDLGLQLEGTEKKEEEEDYCKRRCDVTTGHGVIGCNGKKWSADVKLIDSAISGERGGRRKGVVHYKG